MKKNPYIVVLTILGIAVPSMSYAAFGDTPCSNCHVWNDCTSPKGECGSCHELPPATGAHFAHFAGSDATLTYGDLRITADFAGGLPAAANMIGCGNCHPMDSASHGNGVWGDIEFANAAAPADSLKALNAGGTYDGATGTCSNIYCHSTNSWATNGTVPMPWPEATGWDKYVDPLPRPLPDNIVTTRIYRDVVWDNGQSLTCDGCHGNSPATSSLDNDGGAGDSHYWVDPYGYENLHVWNMGYEALSCRTCHYETVREPSTTTIDPATFRRVYNDVALFDKSSHVNGTVDVAFDTVNGFTYSRSSGIPKHYDLAAASYDPADRTCSNIGCHIQETKVIWGLPYRWYDYGQECDRCHGYY